MLIIFVISLVYVIKIFHCEIHYKLYCSLIFTIMTLFIIGIYEYEKNTFTRFLQIIIFLLLGTIIFIVPSLYCAHITVQDSLTYMAISAYLGVSVYVYYNGKDSKIT
jgi:uncharacterized membrane protein